MKTKKTFIIIGGAVIVLAALAWLGSPARYNKNGSGGSATVAGDSAGTLQTQETSFDFGSISMAAGTVSRTFKIKNTGAGAVNIEKLYTSCMCTTALLKNGDKRFGPYGMPGHGFVPSINSSLDAGEEAEVEVVFDPAAHGPAGIGRISRDIIIENNGGDPLLLRINAQVTP